MRRIPRFRSPFGGSVEAAAEPPVQNLGYASEADSESRVNQTFRAFKHRNYRIFYTGQAVSLTGTWMQTIAQSWLVL